MNDLNYVIRRTAVYHSSQKNVSRKHIWSDLLENAFDSISVNKPTDWNDIHDFVLNHEENKENIYNKINIDGLIMKWCVQNNKTSYAESYIKYLRQSDKEINLATFGLYLRSICQSNLVKLEPEKETEIIQMCTDVKNSHPVLDSITLEDIICALSLTHKWEDCIPLLEEVKLTKTISTRAYSFVISAAFLNNNEKLAWALANELLELDREPLTMVYLSYLKSIKKLEKGGNIVEKLEILFDFFKRNGLICREDVAKELLLYRNTSNVLVKFSGFCNVCKTKLTKMELTDDEFSELKEVFLKNVIIGQDIFIKSDPLEMGQFKEFVTNLGKFDVILDGLNIAYSVGTNKGTQVFSKLVASVISYFVQQKKSVLMLGRTHMNKWPKSNWNYIKNNCTIFLAKDISQDDPYLLYCALHSGPKTIIVTRDQMRGHRHLLKDRKYKMLFTKWLAQRQYELLTFNKNDKPIFRIPPHFSTIAQNSENIWHIPYKSQDKNNSINDNYHKNWVCSKLEK